MNLPSLGVRRPVTVLMLFLGVLLFGVLALTRLPIDMMPEFEFPVVSVVTFYPGAGAEDIEGSVTEIIEDAVSTINGVEHLDSVSQNNLSVVSIQFEWGTDLTEAANEVRDRLETAKAFLPGDIDAPRLMKMSSSMIPVLVMGATAEESYDGLNYIIEEQIAKPLQRVEGVADVAVMGGPKREIQVLIDPTRLEAVGLSVGQIAQVLAAENLDVPAGDIKMGWGEYTVRVPGKLTDTSQLSEVVVGQHAGKLIRLGDIAEVRDDFAEMRMEARANSRPGVIFFAYKKPGSNTVAVARRILAKIDEIRGQLPPDVEIVTFFDTADFIGRALRNLRSAMMFGALGVMVVILLFLRRVRSTIIIGLTIPFSIVAALFALYLLGFTINMVSLMSLAIAIGLVVDSAVVVLENVTRHVESGARLREASIYAPAEIGQALTASILTTVVVFVPMLFITGITGILARQMAVVVIVAISVSLFAALTLTPALTSTLLRRSAKTKGGLAGVRGRFFRWGERALSGLEDWYARLLARALSNRRRTILISLAVFVASLALTPFLEAEFFPEVDSGDIEINVELAPGTNLERTMEVMRRIEGIIEEEVPERELYYSWAGETGGGHAVAEGGKEGTHIGQAGVRLVSRRERDRSSQEVGRILRGRIQEIPGVVKLTVRAGSPIAAFMGMGGQAISIEIQGNDIDLLTAVAEEIKGVVEKIPGAVDVEMDVGDPRPELHVVIDKEKASSLGLNSGLIAGALRSQVFGIEATKMREKGDEWEVILRAPEDRRSTVADLLALPIPSVTGQMVRLSSVATIEPGVGPTEIRRHDQGRIVKVEGALLGRSLSAVSADVRREVGQLSVPKGIEVELGGDVEQQRTAFRELTMLLLLGIVLVYMVMAAQFESLVDPFVVMFSIPFAFVGVIWAFLVTRTPLSMTSFLGVIMLMGIVVNNAIVLVDYTNIMRRRGLEIGEALLVSGRRRLRPVLMTAFTTIFGMLPLAVSQYDGSEVWRPLGITMIGGLLVSTLVTLVLVPTMYSVFEARLKGSRRGAV